MIRRYPGVVPFSDTFQDQAIFFGRSEDCKKLLYYILAEPLTVLYSKSGYGKTSILQAGVSNLLREQNYWPFYIRLNKNGQEPEELIKSEILKGCRDGYEVVVGSPAEPIETFLNNLEIWSSDDILVTPVLIFDQFEEMFTLEHNREYRDKFATQLAGILLKVREGIMRIKFVLSLREDYIGHLEKFSPKIPSILSNRYRLEALSSLEASNAIVNPGKANLDNIQFDSPIIQFSMEALQELLGFLSLRLVENKWIATNEIEPVQMQIICRTIEERAISSAEKNIYLVTSEVLGGNQGLKSILITFYDKQIINLKSQLSLSRKELNALLNFIECGLILKNKRVPVELESIKERKNIRMDAVNILINMKLLNVEKFQHNSLVEISHDTLVEAIQVSKQNREQIKENQRRRVFTIFSMGSLLILIAIFVLLFIKPLRRDSVSKESFDSLKHVTYQAQIDKENVKELYIKGFSGDDKVTKGEVPERFKADSVLRTINVRERINPELVIEYRKKLSDQSGIKSQQKLNQSLKDFGYIKFTEMPTTNDRLEQGETNTLVYTDKVEFSDFKIIMLTLIRAGFRIRRVYKSVKRPDINLIQIVRTDYKNNANDKPIVTVNDLIKARSISDISKYH